MIGAPWIGQTSAPEAMGYAGTPALRFGPVRGSTGITRTRPGVRSEARRLLKPRMVVTSTPYCAARPAGESPLLTTTTTPGTGGSLRASPAWSGRRRPGFDHTISRHVTPVALAMLASVSPALTV